MTTPEEMSRLEERIVALEKQQQMLGKQLLQAEMTQWEGRIDDLEVQLHLGARQLSDRLSPLVDTLRNRWLDAREEISSTSSTASEVMEKVRSGLVQAMNDIKTSLLEAKDAVSD